MSEREAGEGAAPAPLPSAVTPERRAAQAEMFVNRLRKNARHRRKWAKREGVTCYRLYDRDIPEVPMVIDWYEGRLYGAIVPHEDTPDEEAEALGEAWLEAARAALEVAPERSYLKRRERQRGSAQYTPVARQGERFEVGEAGLRFWVNLSDYLDTGLFLDHRQTRELVAAEARGKRVLNLFAYTGSFTVHAAAAGARSTTTVDSTPTYLRWAQDNLRLNGLEGFQHELIRSDVGEYLRGARAAGARFDLVVLDPPTFSNSKGTPTFDVRRHHPALFELLWGVVSPGGVVYFSTNARKFKLSEEIRAGWEAEEITERTVPPDFEQRRPHMCWRCVRKG